MKNTQSLTAKDLASDFYGKYKRIIVAFILILLLFIFGELAVSNFMSFEQLLLTIKLASFIALFGLCQMVVIAAGGSGLDLSVGYTATITAVLAAGIMDGRNGMPLVTSILLAVGIGFAIGLANGLLTAYVKLPALVVTLGMANVVQGIINVYTAGANITGRPAPVLQQLAAKSTGIFPNVLLILFIVIVAVMFILYKTKLGQILFATGSNETAAFLSGTNVKRVRCTAFIISGVLASLIGLLLLGNMGLAFKDMGSNYVMPSIAAAVVGGVSLTGGDGNYIGVVLGAVFLQTLTNLLVAFGWGDAGKWLGFGIVLFVLLIVYVSDRRRR